MASRRDATDQSIGSSTNPQQLETIAGGSTALIKLRASGALVEKAPYPDSIDYHLSIRDLQREYAIYQRLPRHPRLLQLHSDSSPQRLVLPYLKHGCLNACLRDQSSISLVQRLQLAADAAEGLHALHTEGIVHGDLNSWNFLVDNDLRLCIIDFAGSTVDGVAGSAFEGVRYCFPRPIDDPSTVRTDLFAMKSVIYEIMTGEQPLQGYEDGEIENRFRKQQFPTTSNIRLGGVIQECWQGRYSSAQLVHEDVLEALDKIRGDSKTS